MKSFVKFTLIFLLILQTLTAVAMSPMKKAVPSNPGEYDVFLLIGQSNMAGRASLSDTDKEPIDGVFLLDADGTVVAASQPLNRFSSIRKRLSMQKMNIGGSFARDISTATGRKVLLVVNARGGTSVRLWQRDSECLTAKAGQDDLWTDGEPIPAFFDEAVRRTKQAMRYGSLKGILWHQGEADACGSAAPLWLDKVAAMVEGLRAELGVGSEVPFIAGETLQNFKNAYIINPVIDRIASKVPGSDFVSSEGCESNSDNLHFSSQGVTVMGHRYACKILEMVYGFSPEAARKATNE